MTDESKPATVAQMLDLEQHDPWDKRSEARKNSDALRKKISDSFTHVETIATFCDPPDDENLLIEGRGAVFYKLSITGRKLSTVVAMEPSIQSVAIVARNNAVGCWLALTSARVAQRLVEALQPRGVAVELTRVDNSGKLADRLNLVTLDNWLNGAESQKTPE